MPQETIALEKMVDLLFEFGEAQGMEITYQGIARVTGIAWNNIRKIRLGENNNPSLHTIQALSDYFGVKLDYFNCRTEDECRDYLGRLAEKDISGQMDTIGVKMRSSGVSMEGLQALQAMIDYVKRAEGLVPSDQSDQEGA
jgi:transcriptional regulator with XRE-family HTH domain